MSNPSSPSLNPCWQGKIKKSFHDLGKAELYWMDDRETTYSKIAIDRLYDNFHEMGNKTFYFIAAVPIHNSLSHILVEACIQNNNRYAYKQKLIHNIDLLCDFIENGIEFPLNQISDFNYEHLEKHYGQIFVFQEPFFEKIKLKFFN
jgi:hypothetical protein